MKIFRCDQIKEIDEFSIRHEPITSIDLMERAAGELYRWIKGRYKRSDNFVIFAGPGNNGGDGLALARLLNLDRFNVVVYFVNATDKTSGDWELNRYRLKTETSLQLNTISNPDEFPAIFPGMVIIDAIFGSGLTRPAEGLYAEVIQKINQLNSTVISVDIPSGLFGEDNNSNNPENIIKADFTLSFHFPKLAFMFAENARYVGNWKVIPIGLNEDFITNKISPFSYFEKSDLSHLIKVRNKFDHKGSFGHGLLIAGSLGKMGAAVLGAGAALRTGIGLVTCHIPSCGGLIVQCSVPEAMIDADKSENSVSDIGKTDSFSAVGIGPGLGTEPESQKALHYLLTECKKPMVLDADALNILSLNKEWFSILPELTILTPHPKEFERLTGKSDSDYDRLEKQIRFSEKFNCIVVLKGANTSVSTPGGKIIFNSTGNPGMATGGSGDVLTGIILSLLAQGYTPHNAAIIGVFLHGKAGDIAAKESCFESIIASDIINCIGKAFNEIRYNDTDQLR